MTDLPVRSTRAAPAGAATSPFFPTLVNLPPSMTKAPSSMTVPSPVITLAPWNTVASLCPARSARGVSGDEHADRSRHAATRKQADVPFGRHMVKPVRKLMGLDGDTI